MWPMAFKLHFLYTESLQLLFEYLFPILKMDLISFWHSHFLLFFISISGKCGIIWISHVAVGKTGL